MSNESPPLLFLHGFTCDPSSWREQQDYFAKRTTVRAPLLPLHGDKPAPAEPTVEGLADAIAIDLRREHLQPVVIGHSLGGMVGLHLALRHADLIRALVLADAFPALSLNSKVLPEFHGPTTPEILRKRATDMMNVGRKQMGEPMRAKLWESIRTMDVTERLKGIHAPVLGIYGGRGRYRADQAGELKKALLLDRLPKCEVVIVSDAGHFVMWEQPELFNKHIARFAGISS